MIVKGQAPMSFELSPEAVRQLRLRYHIASEASKTYLEAGFSVVYQDVIIGPELLEVVQLYQDVPLFVVVLRPQAEVIASREAGRGKTGYQDEAMIYAFDRVLREETPRLGYWLDTSHLTVSESVDAILAHLSQARIVQL
jgi:chloramphenicol 3-O-phosphotransferase